MSHIKNLWHAYCKNIGRIVAGANAWNILVKQLTFENADKVCKAALQLNRKRATLQEMIRICVDVGPSHIQAIALTAALKKCSSLREGKKGACLSCGEEGHFARECQNKPQPQLGISVSGTGPPISASGPMLNPLGYILVVRGEIIGQMNVTPKHI
jgi:hypothetical protein